MKPNMPFVGKYPDRAFIGMQANAILERMFHDCYKKCNGFVTALQQ